MNSVVTGRPIKGNFLRRIALDQVGEFTLGDLVAQAPGVSPQLVKKVLAELKSEGSVVLVERGRVARWRVSPQR